MSDTVAAIVVLVCTFGGTLLGMWLGGVLPEHHLNAPSRDTIKVGMGLTATMTALVLGLVTASAKGDFDDVDDATRDQATNVLVLDRALARYGPETAQIRQSVRRVVDARIAAIWPEESGASSGTGGPVVTNALEALEDAIEALPGDTDARRRFKSQSLDMADDALRTRWGILQSEARSIPRAFLVILVCWLTLIFTSFGLLAPRNPTTLGVLLLSALSVAASMFLILELADPFEGVIKISSAPLRYVTSHLGQ